jgi:hypothetical protein
MTLATQLPSGDDDRARSKLRSWADQHTLALPDPRKAAPVAKYWSRKLPELAVLSVPKLLKLLLLQIRPTLRGLGKCFDAYHNWLNCHTVRDGIKDAESKNKKADLALIHHRAHGRRLTFSVIVGMLLISLGFYAYFYHFTILVVTGLVVLAGINTVGQRGRSAMEENEEKAEFVPTIRPMFQEGMPLQTLVASVKAVLAECGLEVELGPADWNPDRKDYRIAVSCYKELNEEHLRAIERGVGWNEGVARWVSDGPATTKTLVTRYGDPFANVPCAPDIPPNSRCISRPIELGVSYTDKPFALNFAGVHMGVVAQSGGGKTEGVLDAIINGVSACHNASLVGIDLTEGPAFGWWNDVIQKVAYDPETAEDLFNWLDEERRRRMKILRDIARSSDPNATAKEWNAELAEKHDAQAIVCVVDELPQLIAYDGKNGTINLVKPLQKLVQTSSKVWISFILAAQDTGRGDFGTTIIANQIMTWLVGPCSRDDANKIFTAKGRASGFNPELLHPGVRNGPSNDAGRVYVKAPHFGPDMFATWHPSPASSTKRRAAERVAAGRPSLEPEIVDAVTLPPALEALLGAMNSYNLSADRVSSAYVATWLSNQGGRWDSKSLLEDLREECGTFAPVTRPGKLNGATVWCYWREDVDRAVAAL